MSSITGPPACTSDGTRGFPTASPKAVGASILIAALSPPPPRSAQGIYLLRPPQHKQLLLANAQYDWLAAQGAAQGWRPLQDGLEAQRYANQGWFVLATYKNHRGDLPGHIAIVRPSEKDARTIALEGPQITQAGGTNYRSVALRAGFAGHPSAWVQHEVRFYAHAVPPGASN